MATGNTVSVIPPDLIVDLQMAAEQAADGIRDLDEARKAAKEVDTLREENRRRFGEEAIGDSIIREFRGPLPE